MRPPAVLFQEKKASENIIMRNYKNIFTILCLSKKTSVVRHSAASGVFLFQEKDV